MEATVAQKYPYGESPNTRPIGRGSCNVTANMPEPLAERLRRHAVNECDVPVSYYIKVVVQQALDAGVKVTKASVLVLSGVGVGLVAFAALRGDHSERIVRMPRQANVRTVRRREGSGPFFLELEKGAVA